jgi:hypothetical protein
MSAFLQGCLCCSTHAAQQRTRKFSCGGDIDGSDDIYFVCSNKACGRKQKFTCAVLFCKCVLSAKVPEPVYRSSPWVQAVLPFIHTAAPQSDIYIPNCLSCVVSASLDHNTSSELKNIPAIVQPPRYSFKPHQAGTRKPKRQKNCSMVQVPPGDVMAYLSGYGTIRLFPPNYNKLSLKLKRNKSVGRWSEFEGALYFPPYRLLITSYASNKHLYTDYHALAKSKDGTPAIPHMVLGRENALCLQEYYNQHGIRIPYISNDMFIPLKIENVPMPEKTSLTRSWDTEYVLIKQQYAIENSKSNTGRQSIPLEELIECKVLSWRKLRRFCELITVVGDFSQEQDEQLRSTGRKLLCGRLQSMLQSSIPDKTVEELYHSILPSCGKGGYELKRTGGACGMTSSQTTKDLLCVLHRSNTLLPNKAGACLILQDSKYYWIFYSKHNKKLESHPIAHIKYTPPNIGGSVRLEGSMIDFFPIIGEFCYCKMLVALIYDQMNKNYLDVTCQPVATEPLRSELKSIEYARGAYSISGSYSAFCRSFLSCNSMTLVTWPVGEHNDHIHRNGEEFENKLLLVLPSIKDTVGRGGSFLGNQYVFGLLDWKYFSKTVRTFYVNHANDMGIGPPHASNSKSHLEDFFEHGGSAGEQWARQFNQMYENQLCYVRGQGIQNLEHQES